MQVRVIAVVALALCLTASAQSTPAPTLSKDPISVEQMSIYRDFFAQYDNGSGSVVNIAQSTAPLTKDALSAHGCLDGFDLNKTSTTIHSFASDAFPATKARLVDPETHQRSDPGDAIRHGQSVDDAVRAGFAAGIFTFSEIAFDASHTHAAFSYSFVCGGLCGHGGVTLYDLVDGKWRLSKKTCGSWIS